MEVSSKYCRDAAWWLPVVDAMSDGDNVAIAEALSEILRNQWSKSWPVNCAQRSTLKSESGRGLRCFD